MISRYRFKRGKVTISEIRAENQQEAEGLVGLNPKDYDGIEILPDGHTLAAAGEVVTSLDVITPPDVAQIVPPGKPPRKVRKDKGETRGKKENNPESAKKVRSRGEFFLFETLPIATGSHQAILNYIIAKKVEAPCVVRGVRFEYERTWKDSLKPVK